MILIAVIGVALLGVALIVPNVVAVRTAFAGAAEREAARAQARAQARAGGRKAGAPAAARVRRRIPAPRFVRRAYLWKALSPLLFALSIMFGIAIGGTTGYVLMGLGLLNLLLGLWGWDEYVPGHAGERE